MIDDSCVIIILRCSLLLFGSLLSCQLVCETGTSHSTKPDQLKPLGQCGNHSNGGVTQ